MAIPRFNFGSGSSGLYNPNQILVPTKLTSTDKNQLLDYDKKIADYKTQVDAYNKAVEEHNKSGQGTFSQKEPTDPGITQKEIDTFGAESAARAQQLQTARQNALNILQNPEGFSSYYGIGSLGFEEGGEVPVNFVGTGEFPETDPSVGYRTGPVSQDKDLPLAAELLVDFTPVVGDVKAGIEAADYFNKGEYGNAALAGVGVLPFVPPLVGMAKKVKGLTVDSLKRKPKPIAPDADVSKTRELLGVTDESAKEWKKNVSDPYMLQKFGDTQNKPPKEAQLKLARQANLLEKGEISPNDFRNFVDTNFSYYFHESVPEIRSMQENALALGKKVDNKGILGLNRYLPEGAETQIRFDITAYQNNDIYTSTLYEGLEGQGKLHSYAQTGALKNVTFPVDEKQIKESKKIAGIGVDKPKAKSPVVRMKGNWVEHSPEELREIAMEALEQNKNLPLKQQEWVQVGVNPAKGASWVALEKTADGVKSVPITGADEVIQIGKLVLARKPKLQSWDDYYKTASFEEGGAVSEGIGSLGFEGGGDVPFFLEAEPTRSNVPSQEELTKALLRSFPVLQLLNKTSKIYTELVPDIIKTSVRMGKNPESKEEEFKNLKLRAKDRADSILNMFGTSTEKFMPRDKEPVYKTEFEEGGAVGEGIANLRPSKTTMGLAPYGIRNSGEGAKGLGYFGETTSPSGQAVTEYSLYDEDIGEYPSIVPTLTSEELQDTIRRSSQGQSPSMEVIMKARMYAKDRLSEGKSPFAGPTELRFPVPSQTDDNMLQRID